MRVQRVDPRFWRVIDAAVEPGDPALLIGFVEQRPAGYECTLMAALSEHHSVGTLQAAHEYFERICEAGSEPTC
ncbi:hypothetical protein DEJ13_03550 [Curtobacterium sp. MCLR17_007]|uniref:hypothetical protein n=1 Tax=Curtobacterium sp. MCLR17_007 TaxID=2175648 RepID=UPI0011B8435B|nr:hypothetical protein [Curtobacterium sp. MCLR17_007]WIB60921.1 hypothetical protein DEJ13_03550 [Curtobacterium sp. MCLR17_007]